MQSAVNITFLAIAAAGGAVIENMIHKYQHAQVFEMNQIVEMLAKPTGVLAILIAIGVYFYRKNEKKEAENKKLREEKEQWLKDTIEKLEKEKRDN